MSGRSDNRPKPWLRSLLFMLALLAGPCCAVSARAESLPAISVSISPDTVLVGDRIRCSIRVEHRDSESASIEGIDSLAIKPSVIMAARTTGSVSGPGTRRDVFEYEVAVFARDRQACPPFTVVLRSSDGAVTNRFPVRAPKAVIVKALTDSSMHELRPPKPPVRPEMPLFLLLPFFFAVFGIALAILLLLFFLKRSVRRSAERIDPGQVALRKLRKLSSRLSGGMPPPACYEELSNILRSFLENHFRIRALEAVTQEIERDLEKIGTADLDTVMTLLRQADLVKFADSRPELDESRQSLQKAEEFIRAARTEKTDK